MIWRLMTVATLPATLPTFSLEREMTSYIRVLLFNAIILVIAARRVFRRMRGVQELLVSYVNDDGVQIRTDVFHDPEMQFSKV